MTVQLIPGLCSAMLTLLGNVPEHALISTPEKFLAVARVDATAGKRQLALVDRTDGCSVTICNTKRDLGLLALATGPSSSCSFARGSVLQHRRTLGGGLTIPTQYQLLTPTILRTSLTNSITVASRYGLSWVGSSGSAQILREQEWTAAKDRDISATQFNDVSSGTTRLIIFGEEPLKALRRMAMLLREASDPSAISAIITSRDGAIMLANDTMYTHEGLLDTAAANKGPVPATQRSIDPALDAAAQMMANVACPLARLRIPVGQHALVTAFRIEPGLQAMDPKSCQ